MEWIMRVFVATSATQGARATDFAHCIEGELVWLHPVCRASERDPYGACGCGRSFTGLSSSKHTTTALVWDIPGLTRQEYLDAATAGLELMGWCPDCNDLPVAGFTDWLLAVAGSMREGTVVERLPFEINVRRSLGSGE
jgi:hypothetical protein